MDEHPASQRRDADFRALMARAVDVASTARFRARPNPWVGAVLVCADGSVFEGAHEKRSGRVGACVTRGSQSGDLGMRPARF
jgi:pyrimidine deaminase RibD-like protein